MPNLRLSSFWLCVGVLTTKLEFALVGARLALSWFGDFLVIFFTISHAFEDSRFSMGGMMLWMCSGVIDCHGIYIALGCEG